MSSTTRISKALGRPDGPVFLSYRQSDGTGIANLVETYLRCGGIIPWRDLADLPAGEVARSVREAVEEGLSAGILIVTPELKDSQFVPEHEVPALQRMQRKDPRRFCLYVLNTIRNPENVSGIDVDAPDRLLGLTDNPRTSHRRRRVERGRLAQDRAENRLLRDAKQYALLEATDDLPAVSELGMLLRDLLRRRLRARRVQLWDREIRIAVQTRPVASSEEASRSGRGKADLTIRMEQNPENQLPSELDYRCLQQTLPIIIDSLHNHQVNEVTFTGGCHPSVAWVLGAALPEARGLRKFSWHRPKPRPDQVEGSDEYWSSDSKVEATSLRSSITMRVELPRQDGSPKSIPNTEQLAKMLAGADTGKGIVVHLATGRHDPKPLQGLSRDLGGAPVVVLNVTEPDSGWVPAEEGEALAQRLGELIRGLAQVGELHLSFSAGIPLVALTARHCNTLSVRVYELARHTDQRTDGYVAVLRSSSGGKQPMVEVFTQGAPPKEVTRLVNLTPHDVKLFRGDEVVHVWPRPQLDQWVRRSEQRSEQGVLSVDGVEVPLTQVTQGSLIWVPDDEPGTGFIVSRISAAAARRSDFFFPHGEVRDERNVVQGCRGLGFFPPVQAGVERYLQWLPGSGED